MGSVMSGIAEALVATGAGLFVAIPAVVVYNLVQKKIGDVETGVSVLGKLVSAFVESREHAGEELPRVDATEPTATPVTTSPATERA